MASSSKKRKVTIDPRQKTLFGGSDGVICLQTNMKDKQAEQADKTKDVNNNMDEKTGEQEKSTDTDNTNNNNTENTENKKTVRNWKDKWLKMYSWLRTEETGGKKYMYCQVCTDASKYNALHKSKKNQVFQNTTLTRHAGALVR